MSRFRKIIPSIKRWIQRYILRKEELWIQKETKVSPPLRISREELRALSSQRAQEAKERIARERWLPTPPKPSRRRPREGGRRPRGPKTKAIHQDIGKFMRGSTRQHKWYRRSVKEKVQPEDPEED